MFFDIWHTNMGMFKFLLLHRNLIQNNSIYQYLYCKRCIPRFQKIFGPLTLFVMVSYAFISSAVGLSTLSLHKSWRGVRRELYIVRWELEQRSGACVRGSLSVWACKCLILSKGERNTRQILSIFQTNNYFVFFVLFVCLFLDTHCDVSAQGFHCCDSIFIRALLYLRACMCRICSIYVSMFAPFIFHVYAPSACAESDFAYP